MGHTVESQADISEFASILKQDWEGVLETVLCLLAELSDNICEGERERICGIYSKISTCKTQFLSLY